MSYTTEQLGAALVKAAKEEWARPVRDIEPGQDDDRDHITRYFTETCRADGRSWAWFLIARHPRSEAKYIERTLDGEWEEWCGLWVAWLAQNRIGRHLKDNACIPVRIIPGIAYYVLPGTPRIADPAKWEEAQAPEPLRPDPADAQRGDIFTVGSGANGSHIGLVDWVYDDGTFDTYEGNGRGQLGDGSKGEGAIRRTRDIDEIKQLIRLTPDHYEGIQ